MTSDGRLHAFASQHGKLIDLGELVEGFIPGSVVESLATGITASGVVVGRYTLSTPADPQMPTKTRSFIATIGPPGLLQSLLPSLLDVGSGKKH
jgi:hypothetical protein